MQSKILVADDEAPNRQALEEMLLRAQGYSVILAHDGPGALEEFRRHRPDL